MKKRYKLLIVEDDKSLAQLTYEFFQQFEFDCQIINEGIQAVNLIIDSHFDLVLLDVMLPDLDGLQVCQQVKGQFKGKIIMLTARTDTLDQVLGLEMGADDYVAKPVEPRLLLAKARAVLRRESETNNKNMSQNIIVLNEIELHRHRREIYKAGKQVLLTNPEYELFEFLVQNIGVIVNRNQILMHLRGINYDGQNRQIDITVSNLRSKLEDDPSQPTLIKTIRSKGYLLASKE
ncbi:MAG: response regulator transcription factor [Thalassotalea sp.]|nr:response regulator transcription factor [Thalassotalea sp.]